MRRQKAVQYKKFFVDNGHELVEKAEESDYIIVWGCAFRADHRDNSLDIVEYYVNKFTDKKIVVGIDFEYERKQDVIIQTKLARPDALIVSTIDEIANEIYKYVTNPIFVHDET